MGSQFQSAHFPQDILARASSAEREVLVRTLVAGLRELPPVWCNSEAFRTIITDLDPPLLLHGVAIVLSTELGATSAGEALARMRAHSAEVGEARRSRQAEESPQAVEERKRVKRVKSEIAHTRRQAETSRRNAERLELLAALAQLSAAERLVRFATDPEFKLDRVPAELVPTQEGDLIGLEKAMAVALSTRIGRRTGAWGRLRRMIEHLVRDEPE